MAFVNAVGRAQPNSLAQGGTGSNLTDPNADRILFWDDSAAAIAFLTAGTGLSISGTTITASGGSPGNVGQIITNSAQPNGSTSSSVNLITTAITPSSTSSKILVFGGATIITDLTTSSTSGYLQLDGGNIDVTGWGPIRSGSASSFAFGVFSTLFGMDQPNTASSVSYTLDLYASSGTLTYGNGSRRCYMMLIEVLQ